MKFIFSIGITLLFHSTVLDGQNRTINIPTYENGDTSFLYKGMTELASELGLPLLADSDEPFYFRLWLDGQALDIWMDGDSSLFGQVTSYCRKAKGKVRSKKRKLYSETVSIDKHVVQTVIDLIDSTMIRSIPTQDSIPGWSGGLDGVTYILECSTLQSYTFKDYWTPNAQDSLAEAKLVQHFVERAEELAGMKEYDRKFFASLPYGCYSTGGIMMRCKYKNR